MCDSLTHRGPDEWGFDVKEQVTLGHRRLSIIGLGNGKQPISSHDGNHIISFNGEIYNYQVLKEELVKDGFKFKTDTDTEVILNLYIKYGIDCFKMLNGMFAISIWDQEKERLILARDRMGQKPLFYYYKNQDIVFSSELKALTQHPRFSKTLSTNGLNKFLSYEYIPSPYTIFEDTYKLEAGELAIVTRDNIKKHFYWNYPYSELEGEKDCSTEEAVENIESILRDSVKLRLIADVPVGVLLSGGLDSSLIAALASDEIKRANASNGKQNRLKSFSIYFNEKSYDESDYIKTVVKEFDLDHHAEVVDSQTMLGLFDKLGAIMDEPMADPSLVPTYYLSKAAAKDVKTVLGGDGADELFAGYPTYIANKLVNIYNIIPYELRTFLRDSLSSQNGSLLPVSFKNISLDFKIKQFLRGAGVASEIRFFKWMGGFLEREKQDLLATDIKQDLSGELAYEDINRYLSRTNLSSELDRLLYLSQKLYLLDDILVKVDRASMMSSLEVRAPYLDHRLVEYSASLPERLKLKRFESKYILKKVAEKHLPRKIIYRPKKGFGIPISEWLCKDLKEPMMDLLSKDRLERQGIFEHEAVQNLIDGHLSLKTNNRKQLWTLLSFQLWADEFKI